MNGIRSSPAARIVSSRRSGCFVGEPWWATRSGLTDSSISPCEAVTSRSRARSARVEHAEVRVRQQPALERALAGPDDVGDEVLVAVLGQPRAHAGVDLGPLAGQHEQLLDVAPRGAVEQREHLVGRVQVRAVRRERAVLAVAAAGPRQRERQVAGEGDAPAHARESRSQARARPILARRCAAPGSWQLLLAVAGARRLRRRRQRPRPEQRRHAAAGLPAQRRPHRDLHGVARGYDDALGVDAARPRAGDSTRRRQAARRGRRRRSRCSTSTTSRWRASAGATSSA